MKEKLENLQIGEVLFDVDVKNYTTFKVSANVFCIAIPNSIESLIKLIHFLKQEQVQYKVIGKGSNLVFVKDYEGVLIKLDAFKGVEINDNKVIAGAGASLMEVALKCSNLGFKGLEFATGIPGSMGGGIVQNAGCYGSDMSHVVTAIQVLTPENKIETWNKEQIDFGYRTSIFKEKKDYVILEVEFVLEKGNKEEILEWIKERRNRRLEEQPLDFPSAGSVFRNPEGTSAGKLIDDLGWKGKKVGGAQISTKHANFIINTRNATGSDIKTLVLEIQESVKKEYGIDLVCEQEFVE